MTGVLEACNEGSDVWAFGCASGEVGFLTLDKAGTYRHILKILRDECPYHWVADEWQVPIAITKGPPYIWPNLDSFMESITSCFENNPERRPSSSELVECVNMQGVISTFSHSLVGNTLECPSTGPSSLALEIRI